MQQCGAAMIYHHIFSKTRAGYINFALHFFHGSSWEYFICEQKVYTETPHEPHISRAQHNGYDTLHFSSVAQVNLQFPESCDEKHQTHLLAINAAFVVQRPSAHLTSPSPSRSTSCPPHLCTSNYSRTGLTAWLPRSHTKLTSSPYSS